MALVRGALFFTLGFCKRTIITLPFLVILTELILLNLPLRKKYLLSGVLLVTIAGLIILWSTGILTGILKALHLSFLLRDPRRTFTDNISSPSSGRPPLCAACFFHLTKIWITIFRFQILSLSRKHFGQLLGWRQLRHLLSLPAKK